MSDTKQQELTAAEMTDDQRECYRLLCDLVFGEHHLNGKVRGCGKGIHINLRCQTLGSFDFNGLTRLVVLAHDRCIRVEIVPTGFGAIGIDLHRRQREGAIFERHPTIEEHITNIRKHEIEPAIPIYT